MKITTVKIFILMGMVTQMFFLKAHAHQSELFTLSIAEQCVTEMKKKHLSIYEITSVLKQNAKDKQGVVFPSVETKAFSHQIDGNDCWSYLIEMNHIALEQFNLQDITLMDLMITDEEQEPIAKFQSMSWIQEQIRALYPQPLDHQYALF